MNSKKKDRRKRIVKAQVDANRRKQAKGSAS